MELNYLARWGYQASSPGTPDQFVGLSGAVGAGANLTHQSGNRGMILRAGCRYLCDPGRELLARSNLQEPLAVTA